MIEAPGQIQVEITSRCNLACCMCPLTTGDTPSGWAPAHMQERHWERVRDFAPQCGAVLFCGYGESFLNPAFPEMLEQLDQLGVRTSFSTNGTIFSARHAERLRKLRFLNHINISMDTADPETFRRIRGGNWHVVANNLQRFVQAAPPNCAVTVSAVVMTANINSLAGFPEVLARAGVRRLVLQAPYRLRDTLVQLGPARSSVVDELTDRCREHDIQVERMPETTPGDEILNEVLRLGRRCTAPYDTIFINAQGRVSACCISCHGEILGDLNEESLEQIWVGGRYQSFRKRLRSPGTTPKVCRSCEAVPLGANPLEMFGAQIVSVETEPGIPAKYVVVARNTGSQPWLKETGRQPTVATSAPRDRLSAMFHPTWLSGNRVSYCREDVVQPGETGTFAFLCQPTGQPETFQLVVDSEAWLPATSFTVAQ